MEKYMEVLQASGLFAGVEKNEIQAMLGCLAPQIKSYKRDSFILIAGETTDSLALVLEGSVHILQEDFWGNRNILSAIAPSGAFAESFVATGRPLSVSALAASDATVLFLNLRRVLTTCPTACAHHRRIIENLLAKLAEKNHMLSEKLSHMSKRSTREKLLSYLSAEAVRRGSNMFEIPFNRQQLADYLSVDRSALSAELSKLKGEGLLDFHRSSFKIMR
jgi:CRP-like cAMP-binding protein